MRCQCKTSLVNGLNHLEQVSWDINTGGKYEWSNLQVRDKPTIQAKTCTYLIKPKIFFSTYGQVQDFYFMNQVINFVYTLVSLKSHQYYFLQSPNMIYGCIHNFFVKPHSPHVQWKPVLTWKFTMMLCQQDMLFISEDIWIFSACWRCCDTGGNFYLPGTVIMSSAEQKELKVKLYSLYFYHHLFQSFNVVGFRGGGFLPQSHRVLLHGIHRRSQRPFKPWSIFKQPGERAINCVDTKRLLG